MSYQFVEKLSRPGIIDARARYRAAARRLRNTGLDQLGRPPDLPISWYMGLFLKEKGVRASNHAPAAHYTPIRST